MFSLTRRIFWGALLFSAAHVVCAQPFPVKPIRWIVPYAPGGGQDFVARTISHQLSANLGQPVIVDNKPGGNGSIAAAELLRAEPDGHTLMSVDNGHLIFNPIFYKNLSYQPGRDLALLSTTGRLPLLLIAGPSLDAKTVQEFIAQAKASPAKFSYASVSAGSPHHIAFELMKRRTGIHAVHIPYRGGAPALADVAGGQVPVMMADFAFSQGFIKAGKVRPLAIADTARLRQLPDVLTFAEAGFPGIEAAAFTAVVVKAGTPSNVIDTMNKAIAKVLANPAVGKMLLDAGVEPSPLTPQQFAAMIERETKRWREVIEGQKITVD